MSRMVGGPQALRKRHVSSRLEGSLREGGSGKRDGGDAELSVEKEMGYGSLRTEDAPVTRSITRRVVTSGRSGNEVIDLIEEIERADGTEGSVHAPKEESSEKGGKKMEESRRSSSSDFTVSFDFPPGLKGSVKLTNAEYDRLTPEQYLNDSVIDFYIKFIEIFMTPPDLRDKCYFFNSFFFKRLASAKDPQEINHDHVKRWTQEVNIFSKKYIFVPICNDFHWSLIVICNCGNLSWWKKDTDDPSDRPVMLVYDSLMKSTTANSHPKALKGYLQAEFLSKKEREFEMTGVSEYPDFSKMSTWSPTVPSQKNEYDCGLYVLQYIVSFLQDPPEDFHSKMDVSRKDWFTETDIECLRLHIRLVMQEENLFLLDKRQGQSQKPKVTKQPP